MSSLESQYSSWKTKNTWSDFSFEDWRKWILEPKLKMAVEIINKLKEEE
jgi:hypothetical protein